MATPLVSLADSDVETAPCIVTDTLGDIDHETIGSSSEPTVADIIASASLSVSEQKEYQLWYTEKASTTVEIRFLNGHTAAGDVFGYYKKGDPDSFIPLFKNGQGANALYDAVVVNASPGQTYTVVLPQGDYGFAMHEEFDAIANLRTSENSLNEDSGDYVLVYDVLNAESSYILAFEDLSLSVADKDYNDIVVEISVKSCENPAPNYPPVITLIGANPATTTVGSVYVDPGATALDQEDGDLTEDIVVTGSVDTSTTSTSTLIYSVIDSDGLSALTTRMVTILATSTATTTPPSDPPSSPPPTPPSGGGGGGGGSSRPPSGSGGVVLSASATSECFYLRDYMRRDFNNDPVEVLKLQAFLINFEGHSNLSLTGVFDQTTFDAVSAFQTKYFKDILEPWGHTGPTGYVYILTLKKINEIYCQKIFPLNQAQINEIAAFKASLTQPIVEQVGGISTSTVPIELVPDWSAYKGQNINYLASVLSSESGRLSDTVKYLIGLILVLIVLYIIGMIFNTKYNSMRASVKSWYLVITARVKSAMKEPKNTSPIHKDPLPTIILPPRAPMPTVPKWPLTNTSTEPKIHIISSKKPAKDSQTPPTEPLV